MGCITCDLMLAQKFYEMGVPYWLVRPSSAFSSRIKIIEQVEPERTTIEKEIYPNTNMIWDSPPSAVRNKACQHLRLGNIRVVHPAFQSHPGELQAPSSDRKIQVFLVPNLVLINF